MRSRSACLFLATISAVALVRPAAADVDVQRAGEQLAVRAKNASLQEVLEAIARQTGMKLTYETGAPRPRVNLNLERVSAAEAVQQALEGLGLSYVFAATPDGRGVQSLLIVANSGSGGARSASATQPPPAPVVEELPAPEPAGQEPAPEGAPAGEPQQPPPFPDSVPGMRLMPPGSTPEGGIPPGTSPPMPTPRDSQSGMPQGMSGLPGMTPGGQPTPIPGSPPVAIPRPEDAVLPPGMRPRPQPTPQPN